MTVKTYSLEDLLDYRFPVSKLDGGIDSLAASMQARLDYVNAEVAKMTSSLAETTTDRRRLYGDSVDSSWTEVGELGIKRTQGKTAGQEVNFPMYKFSFSTGWDREWFLRKTVAEFARLGIDATQGYGLRMIAEIKNAMFNKTNPTARADEFTDGVVLSNVKRFLNNDGVVPPVAPDGTTFLASHNHYLGTASLTYENVDSLISTVREHGHNEVALYLPQALVATLSALTGTKLVKDLFVSQVSLVAEIQNVEKAALNRSQSDYKVGYWDGNVPVFVKPFVASGKILCLANAASGNKPLVNRVPEIEEIRGMRLVAELNAHPLTAQVMESYYGFSVWQRSMGAVLDTANATYANPTDVIAGH